MTHRTTFAVVIQPALKLPPKTKVQLYCKLLVCYLISFRYLSVRSQSCQKMTYASYPDVAHVVY